MIIRCIWGPVRAEGKAYNLGVSTESERSPEGALCEARVYTPRPCRPFDSTSDDNLMRKNVKIVKKGDGKFGRYRKKDPSL